MGKIYHRNSVGDELIHVCRRRTFAVGLVLVVVAGVIVAFLQGHGA